MWAYSTSQFCETAAIVYDFRPSRAGEHARNFLQGWKGKLVCDDFGGYKASFELGVTEIGCMAHARRKFFVSVWTSRLAELSQHAWRLALLSLRAMRANQRPQDMVFPDASNFQIVSRISLFFKTQCLQNSFTSHIARQMIGHDSV